MDAFFDFVLGLLVGAVVCFVLTSGAWRHETVERGLALYCPTDGQWAWNGECGE